MSIFKQVNIEHDIEKLQKRESIIKDYKERLGDHFVTMIWDNPDDPFCCDGHPVFRSTRVDHQGNVYAPYIPMTLSSAKIITACITNV